MRRSTAERRDRLPKAARREDAEASVKDFILPLIFTKRLCDVFDDELNRIAAEVGSRKKTFQLGKTALIGDIVFESNMMRFSVDESRVQKEYVFKFLNSPLTKNIIGTAKRAVAQSRINQGDVDSIIVPKPSLEEQREIVAALDATEAKIAHSTDKAAILRDLFRTFLHELMTAKTRVRNFALPM